MSLGSASLARRRSVSAGMDVMMSRCATCSSACTPASVRPDPYNSNCCCPVTSAITRVSSPWTVRAFFWICQPLYFVPAYSMKTLNRAIKNPEPGTLVYLGTWRVFVLHRRRVVMHREPVDGVVQIVGLHGLRHMIVEAAPQRTVA